MTTTDEGGYVPGEVHVANKWIEQASITWAGCVPRVLDVAISIIVLIVALPLLLIVALLIRLESPGPAVFRQERAGRNGRSFKLIKFRGMYVDAKDRWPELYNYSFDDEEVAALRFHPHYDPRVTRIGGFIRRTSIDELPNFLNVLRGDMAIVGPRPEIPEMLPYYGDHLEELLGIRPGVTSLPKVTGRDGHTFAETLELELEYIRNRSMLLDLKIMARTIRTVLRQDGVLGG